MSHSINPLSPPQADDLDSNNLLLTIQYLFLSERAPLESFNSMYLAAGLLLSFCCDAPFRVLSIIEQLRCSLVRMKRFAAGSYRLLYRTVTIQLKNFQTLIIKLFLDCFGPDKNRGLAMTKTPWNHCLWQIPGVFVIARPLVKNIIILSSERPKQSIITQQISANR